MTKLSIQVYSFLEKVPQGRITTYKILANKLGTKAYRAIGQILKNNPDAPRIPCHRVVASNGTIGGFMGSTTGKNIAYKKSLLQNEGIKFSGNKIVDFEKVVYRFN
jgi:methylated-DNA-[protein]-cysteine S-methyltransferase